MPSGLPTTFSWPLWEVLDCSGLRVAECWYVLRGVLVARTWSVARTARDAESGLRDCWAVVIWLPSQAMLVAHRALGLRAASGLLSLFVFGPALVCGDANDFDSSHNLSISRDAAACVSPLSVMPHVRPA